MKILSAKVLLCSHTMDIVVLNTDSPCPIVPECLPSQPSLDLMFHATYDTGVDYVRRIFQIEPEVINQRF
jgi:hypothetical protein